VGTAAQGLAFQTYSGNLCSTNQKSLPAAGNTIPTGSGEAQLHPHSTLNLPSEASPEGCVAGATGTGGNGLKTITSFYPNFYKAIGSR